MIAAVLILASNPKIGGVQWPKVFVKGAAVSRPAANMPYVFGFFDPEDSEAKLFVARLSEFADTYKNRITFVAVSQASKDQTLRFLKGADKFVRMKLAVDESGTVRESVLRSKGTGFAVALYGSKGKLLYTGGPYGPLAQLFSAAASGSNEPYSSPASVGAPEIDSAEAALVKKERSQFFAAFDRLAKRQPEIARGKGINWIGRANALGIGASLQLSEAILRLTGEPSPWAGPIALNLSQLRPLGSREKEFIESTLRKNEAGIGREFWSVAYFAQAWLAINRFNEAERLVKGSIKSASQAKDERWTDSLEQLLKTIQGS